MSVTSYLTRAFQYASSDVVSQQDAVVSDNLFTLSELVAAGSARDVNQPIDRDKLQAMFISTDVAIQITFDTTPTEPIDVLPNAPVCWSLGAGGLAVCPVSESFTGFSINVPGTEDANVNVRFAYDN